MRHLLPLALIFTATTAFAQTREPASPWAPWMGCWQVSEESIEDAEKLLAALTGAPVTQSSRSAARVCVTPSPEGGATMTTLVNGKAVLTETIVADGTTRPLTDPTCKGTQRAEWSTLAPRIYAHTEVTCADQPTRTVSGFSAVVSGPIWIDIQMIESEGRKGMRVRRYRPAADQTGAVASSARTLGTMPLGGKLTLAEIKEASSKLPPEAVQAAVMELAAGGYDLTAERLIDLDNAGVHDSVIDLMVAMSFPNKFVVERARPASGPGAGGFPYGPGYADPWGLIDDYYGWGYFAHPLYYSSYYSPFGYNRWGYYDPYFGTPGVVIINPGDGGNEPQPTGTGRVVDGQGYTRIRPNVPDAPARTGNGGNGWSGASAGSSSGSNGGSSSGGVSTGGYSGGGGGGGRVAVPRPPGGSQN
jgi:uncharacterized membrane protein YgcG